MLRHIRLIGDAVKRMCRITDLIPYVRPEDREDLDEWIATSERPEGRPERKDPAYVDEATWSEYLRFVLERNEHERNDGHAPRALVDGLPEVWCHRTGWSAKTIDGRWCIGMTGNLDTVHDAVLLVNRHSHDGEDERIARWVAASYNRILGIPAEDATEDGRANDAPSDDAVGAPRNRREEIARIVDPVAWRDHDHYAARLRGEGRWPDRPDQIRTIRESYERRIDQVVAESLRRADEIIALDPM